MKIKTLLAFSITAALSFHLALAAEEDTPLAKEMSAMNKSYKALKKQVADPTKKDDSLKLIESIKKNVEASVPLEPAKTTEVQAPEKAAFLEKYKKATMALKTAFEELETAVKTDNAEGVQAAMAKIDKEKKEGHHEFQSEK